MNKELKRIWSLIWLFGIPGAILIYIGATEVFVDATWKSSWTLFIGLWLILLTFLMINKKFANAQADREEKMKKVLPFERMQK